jgi:hypothetical protein
VVSLVEKSLREAKKTTARQTDQPLVARHRREAWIAVP